MTLSPPNKAIWALCAALVGVVFFVLGTSTKDPSHARELVADGDLAGAEAFLTQIATLHNHDPGFRRFHAEVLLARGELARAREAWSSLLRPDSTDPADLLGLGFSLYYLGELDSAAATAERALRSGNNGAQTSRALNLLGLIEFNRGSYENAKVLQTRSFEHASRAADSLALADALRQLGVLAWYGGRVSTALDLTTQALGLYRRHNDRIGEATALSNIGHLFNDKGDRLTAVRFQCEAFALRRSIGDLRGLADSYYFLTTGPFGAKHLPFSAAFRRKSLELSSRIGYAWGKEVAHRALDELPHSRSSLAGNWESIDSVLTQSFEGRIHFQWRGYRLHHRNQEWAKVIPILDNIIAECKAQGYEISRRMALRRRADALMELGDLRGAGEALAAEDGSEELDLTANRNLLKAKLALLKGQKMAARRMLTALAAAADSLYLNEINNPLSGFERAVESVSRFRSEAYQLLVETLLTDSEELIFEVMERERSMPLWIGNPNSREDRREALVRFVDLLQQIDRDPKDQTRMQEVRLLLGTLQQSFLAEEATEEAPAGWKPSDAPSLDAFVRVLRPNEVFVSYFVLRNDILALVVTAEGPADVVRLGVKPEDIASATRILGDAIVRGKQDPSDRVWEAPASFLYEALMDPLAKRGFLEKGKNILISPHRFLSSIPFHVLLRSGAQSGPLLETNNVAYVPSAHFMHRNRQSSPGNLGSVLAVAPSPKALPFTVAEISGIPKGMFKKRMELLGRSATVERVTTVMGDHDVLHIASHARVSEEYPLYSSIDLFDRKIRLYELFRHHPPRRMVILSACESGLTSGLSSEYYNSEELVGFHRAFLNAGVPTVIASLWRVEDRATSDLMSLFYQALSTGSTVLEAFSEAQRRLMQQNKRTSDRLHPFFWGAFKLAGDSR